MFTPGLTPRPPQAPGPEQIADVRVAASKMTGATRRAFEAEMTMKYCGGNARQAESVFGWGRHTVEVGLAERRTGDHVPGRPGRLQWPPTLGRRPSAGGRGPAATGGGPCATRPDVSHAAGLYAPDRHRGVGGTQSPR